ncbi:MAG: hypothetical protein F4Y26_05220 [Gammaproteobacteria bacterium]|nr:hypothetical protein [Gammaproteobacteria bacterium]
MSTKENQLDQDARTPGEKKRDEVRDCKEADDPRECLKKIAEKRGYKQGWVDHMMKAYNLQD